MASFIGLLGAVVAVSVVVGSAVAVLGIITYEIWEALK